MLKLVALTMIPPAVAALMLACGDNAQPSTPTSVAGSPSPSSPSAASSTTPQPTNCTSSTPIQPQSPADAIVNADGDGTPDRLTMFTQPGPPDANRQVPLSPSQDPEFASPRPTLDLHSYELQLVLDEQAAFNIEAVGLGSGFTKAAPIGGYDVDGDGRDELFAVTGSGAYTTWIDVFEFDSSTCALVRITNPEPHWTPPLFAVGASVGNGVGLECADHTLVYTQFTRTSDDPLRYGGKRTTYRLADGHIDQLAQTNVEFDADTTQTVATFTCGTLRLPR